MPRNTLGDHEAPVPALLLTGSGGPGAKAVAECEQMIAAAGKPLPHLGLF
jgi:hypothetical protein